MASFHAAVLAAVFSCFAALPAMAKNVTLTARDGDLTITGELLGFDGEFYRVDSIYGEVTLDGSGVLCAGPGCPDLGAYVAELTLSGAPIMGHVLMPALIEAFALQQGLEATRASNSTSAFSYTLFDPVAQIPQGVFHVKLSSTDEGFADQLVNEADLVMALREVTPEEAMRGQEAGLGDLRDAGRSRVLALDALVPLVSVRNPVTSITTRELAQVLAGNITNWAQFGGPNAPIALHLYDPGTGLGQATEQRMFPGDAPERAKGVSYHMDGEALSQAVAQDSLALGIGNRSQLGQSVELALSGDCGFALLATRRTVKTEDYPLSAPMLLYLPAHRLPRLMRDFLTFTRGPAAQLVIRRAGFVDQFPEEIAINDQGDRFANAVLRAETDSTLSDLQRMIRILRPLKRLTPTFRFEPGSAELDARSRSNVDSLAHALNSGFHDGRQLVFVGFSDSQGPTDLNRTIALERAEVVRDAVLYTADSRHLDRLTLATEAFGAAMPMACEDTEAGRRANRRVEIWIR